MREHVSRWPEALTALCLLACCYASTARAQEQPASEANSGEVAELIAAAESEALLDTSAPTLRFYGFMDAGLQRAWGDLFKTGLSQSE